MMNRSSARNFKTSLQLSVANIPRRVDDQMKHFRLERLLHMCIGNRDEDNRSICDNWPNDGCIELELAPHM